VRIVIIDNVEWTVADQLGTPRMVFDKTGALANVKRHDYLPFGEELSAGQGARSTTLGYSVPDGVRQKFTSKERDIETGLDYFEARYYSSIQGRFTSVDPDNAGGDATDPQSWNGFAYVGNSPLISTDPHGLWKQVNCTSGSGQCWQAEKGDSIGSLAKLLNLSSKKLNAFFQNPGVEVGQVYDVSGFHLNNNTTIRDEGPAVVRVFLLSEPEKSRTDMLMAGVAVAVEADPEPDTKVAGAALIALYLLKQKLDQQLLDKTPHTHPDDFEPVKGTPGKRNKKTGEVWERDRLHKNHWEVYRNKKDYDNGKRDRSVWDDGRLKEKF
jgi:RHS repeat-associated protein